MVSATAPSTALAAILLLLLLSCLAGPSDAAAANLQNISCSAADNTIPGDAYTANLYQLLAALPENTVSKNGGFFNGTVGTPGAPGTAYGLALCSADYPRPNCLDCLTTATNNASGMLKQCPGSRTVFAIYDQCFLHYSDAEFFGTNYSDIKYYFYGTSRPQSSIDYSGALAQAFVYLNAEAASSPKRFAASKASPYSLAQCTWDLSPDKCKACLDLLAPYVSAFMQIRSTGEAKTYSCRLRHSEVSFDVFPFADANTTSDHDGHVDREQSTRNRTVIIAVVVSVGAVLAVLLAVAVVLCRHRRRARRAQAWPWRGATGLAPETGRAPPGHRVLVSPRAAEISGPAPGARAGSISMNGTSVHIDHLQDYTYEELKKATGGFSKDSKIGRGAFGVVYKGILADGKVLAVKLQRTEKMEVAQFMNEVSILSGLKHKNLVKLEGYCVHGQEGLLCYGYLPDGTLEDRLHGDGKTKMSWKERPHVLVGICRGLQYLHDESPNDISIMHMDLKTDDILLQVQVQAKGAQEDKIITPKISDFGISRNLHNDKQQEYVVQVVGNTSCVPQEFIERGKASTKVDIFSFGLIILEVVTGKPRGSWSSTAQEKRHSEGFTKQVCGDWEKEEIDKLKDASMDNDCHHEIEKCIEIALECVHEEPTMRPDIAAIIRRLTDIAHFNKKQKS